MRMWLWPSGHYSSLFRAVYETVSYTLDDMDTLIELIAEQISNMNAAHQMAEAAR